MALPNLLKTIEAAEYQIDRLLAHKIDAERLEARYQHFIGEMVMLRLFSIFEDTVAEIAFKLAAGGKYLNGSAPTMLVRAGRVQDARALYLGYGLAKPKQYLKWTKASYIRDSVSTIMPENEKYVTNVQNHGQVIEEMRKVRNVLAHNTTSARADFKNVIRTNYGVNISISPGVFLISTKRSATCNLRRYLSSTQIILRAMAAGI